MDLNKGIAVDDICVLCSSSSELALHVFTKCPFARAVCSSANIEHGPLRSSFSCFLAWLSCRAAILKHGQFDLLLVLIHSIWHARNSLPWDDKQENPIVVSRLAGLFLSDFVSAQPQTAPCPLLSPSWWSPPPPTWIKINVDASFCSNSKCGGIDVVFRDEAGIYVGGFICKIPHAIDPYIVEILVARAGLHQAAQWHWRLVILESDALQVVQALHSPHCGVSTTSLLIEDVKASLQSFATVKVNHIRRFANVAVHSMAKLALSSTVPSLWFEVPLVTIQDALLHDCMLH